MAISVARVTRFGIGGGIWRPAGDFSGKVETILTGRRSIVALIHTFNADGGGKSESVTITTTSTPSAKSGGYTGGSAIISTTQPCFVRTGAGTPVALDTGVDLFLLADVMVRITGIPLGHQLAFIKISGGTDGVAYVTPEGESA